MMRVAMVVPGGVDESGTRNVIPALLWLIRRLSREIDLHVFSMRGESVARSWPLEGATVHAVGGNGRRSMRTVRTILGRHRSEPFDVLHAFWASGPGVPAAAVARVTRSPLLLHVTGGDLVSLPGIGYGGRRGAIGRARVAFAIRSAKRLTVPSEAMAEELGALGRSAERVPVGVDLATWPVRLPQPRDTGRPARLVHVASLNRVKDQRTLLRAMKHLVAAGIDFTLDIVGEDTLDGEIQRLAGAEGLDSRIRFHGFLEQDALRRVVTGACLLIMSSLHEADPVVVLEAAVSGVPTVGTRVGHIRDWSPGAALAVAQGDARALADAIVTVLTNEPLRLSMARRAQARALAEDADWSAARVLELYESLRRNEA